AVGDAYCRLPGQDTLDLNGNLGQADGLANQVNTALRWKIFRFLSLLRCIRCAEYPQICIIDCNQYTLNFWVFDLAQNELAAPHQIAQISGKVDADIVPERSRTTPGYTQGAADRAGSPVGCNQVIRANGGTRSVCPVCYNSSHASIVLLERNQLCVEA